VAAITSEVGLAEFGEEAIEANLHDPAWLEAKVRAHEAVLETAVVRSTLVPLRFGTIYRSEDQVRTMLREHDFVPALDRLRGTVELGVKAFVDVEEFDRRHGGTEEDTAEGGRAYLLRKQRDRRLLEERGRFGAACAEATHERLTQAAVESRANALQRPEVSGSDAAMILNGAYLVRTDDTEAFRATLAELASAYKADGVRYDLTGPWPPFNFVEPEDEQ
jgi:hypothetical protein